MTGDPSFVWVISMSLLAHRRINVMTCVHISQDLIKSFFRKWDSFSLIYVHAHEWNTQYYESSYRFLMRLFIFLSRAFSHFPSRCVNRVYARSNFVNMNHRARAHVSIPQLSYALTRIGAIMSTDQPAKLINDFQSHDRDVSSRVIAIYANSISVQCEKQSYNCDRQS